MDWIQVTKLTTFSESPYDIYLIESPCLNNFTNVIIIVYLSVVTEIFLQLICMKWETTIAMKLQHH